MPIIDHNVQKMLRNAGANVSDPSEATDIQSRLDRKTLSIDETLERLLDVVDGADTSSVKLRAIEAVLKLHGILKDQATPPPAVNIIINDKDSPYAAGLNPILIPRQQSVQ